MQFIIFRKWVKTPFLDDPLNGPLKKIAQRIQVLDNKILKVEALNN